jgi:cytoskeletal protein CcmA (bactofilin family)
MFSKSAEGETLPATRADAAPGGTSHLSADLKVTGNISSAGTVEVMGEVQGDIEANVLTVGDGGRVNGKIRAETVEVKGRLDGSASCRQATLRSSAVAKVQITYDTLVIESGAEVEGKFKYAGSKS